MDYNICFSSSRHEWEMVELDSTRGKEVNRELKAHFFPLEEVVSSGGGGGVYRKLM